MRVFQNIRILVISLKENLFLDGRISENLPQFTYLGWDIALTTTGPVAIETNLNFVFDHYQALMGGLRDLFEIDSPQFYWDKKFAGLY